MFLNFSWLPTGFWINFDSKLAGVFASGAVLRALPSPTSTPKGIGGYVLDTEKTMERVSRAETVEKYEFSESVKFFGLFRRPKIAEMELLEVPRIFQNYSPELRSMSD